MASPEYRAARTSALVQLCPEINGAASFQGGTVSSESVSGGGSNRSLVIILAIVAAIALILGILWITGSAPSFLDSGSHVKGGGNHIFRGVAGFVVAIACGIGAWWTNKKA
jgi:hypothetical protein